MVIVSWVLVGILVGAAARFVAYGYGFVEDLIVSVVGSVVGGWVFVLLSGADVTTMVFPSISGSLLGAVLFIILSRSVTRGRTAI